MEEIERAHRSPPPLPAAAATATTMFSVLGDDDLLREILLLLVLPTSLISAALVCRRWYRLASDPAFLRRFGDLHPAPILGVYLSTHGWSRPRFFPIRPLCPELATVVRRAGSFFDAFDGSAFIHDSRGGRLLVTAFEDEYSYSSRTHLLCSPLSSARNAVVVPPVPRRPPIQLTITPEKGVIDHYCYCTSLPDGGDGRSYISVLVGLGEQQTTVCLYDLQDMCWVARSSAAAQLPVSPSRFKVTLFHDSKFYILTAGNKILVCDFPSSSISVMELPNGVNNRSDSIMLSRRDGSGIYLIHVKESLLRVFHSDNSGNWFHVHSICLREVCANLGMTDCPSLDGHTRRVTIQAVGDNAKFVFLKIFRTIVFLDIMSKQAEKVYKMIPEDNTLISAHPLMLIWPPIFPQLKER